MGNSIYHSTIIYKRLKQLGICRFFTNTYVSHIMSVLLTVFTVGYRGKTVNFEKHSLCHRTTIAHFLNSGKWDDTRLENILKQAVIDIIYAASKCTEKPVYCIIDDTITSKTKPSSKASHPIEDAYFHQSHLKKRQDYGHQAVGVMLSCNGICLNYAIIMYDKTKSKIQIVQEIAKELPIPPVPSYLLCDSWYTAGKVMDSFIKNGFYTIGALKTNRVIYPTGIHQKISEFVQFIKKDDKAVRLVTAGRRQYYVYRYEGRLNDIDDAVVLISFPKNAFGKEKALRAFICTDTSLTTQEILDTYVERWPIEVFFRQSKGVLALDKYQIRRAKGIHRYWLLMSLAHFLCCTDSECGCHSFESGYRHIQGEVMREQINWVYHCGQCGIPLDTIMPLVA